MKKIFYTPEGTVERHLTNKEIKEFAERGDLDCFRYLKRAEYRNARNLKTKIDIIAEFLGLKEDKP